MAREGRLKVGRRNHDLGTDVPVHWLHYADTAGPWIYGLIQCCPGDTRRAMDVKLALIACQHLRTEGRQVHALWLTKECDSCELLERLSLGPYL